MALFFSGAGDHVEGALTLRYANGAPPRDHRPVRLHRGHYDVAARVHLDGQPERAISRALEIDQAGTYTLDLL